MGPIRVALVEDEALFRDLVRIVLSQSPRLAVVGDFADGERALAAIPRLAPDVVVLDLELGSGIHGIQLGLELRRQLPRLGIVLLSNHEDLRLLASLPRSDLTGWSYLLKKAVGDTGALVRAIERTAAGFVALDSQLIARLRPRPDGVLARLTPRQREIVALIAQGFTNATIAERLGLAEKSVENQTSLLYQHLEVDHADAAVHPRVSAVLTYLRESGQR
jgi:DNA-binding NarL/FixJ family response regulator